MSGSRFGGYPAEWFLGETLGRTDIARIFNVDPSTVSRWAKQGVIGFYRGPGHIRIFPECEVQRLLADEPPSEFIKLNAERDNLKYEAKHKAGWRNSGVPIHERKKRMAEAQAAIDAEEADEDE